MRRGRQDERMKGAGGEEERSRWREGEERRKGAGGEERRKRREEERSRRRERRDKPNKIVNKALSWYHCTNDLNEKK